MRVIDYLKKPEYLFRPGQVWRRLGRGLEGRTGVETVSLPWGMQLRIHPDEIIGKAIWEMGLYDLTVSETLARLLKPGDRAVDAGANIGYMTGVMAWRVGESGQVWSFEPHPELVEELRGNVSLWGREGSAVRVMAKAVGETEGEAVLVQPKEFGVNRGTSSLVGEFGSESGFGTRFTVELTRLDIICNDIAKIDLLKVDVEGGELAVLRGAAGLLRARRIRHVVFEEHGAYPTPVTKYLESNGYEVFQLVKGWLGPGLVPGGERVEGPAWAPPSFLATVDSEGSRRAFEGKGWRVLGW